MPCSVCNEDGHNARTCPKKNGSNTPELSGQHALWLKFDGLTELQANELLKRAIDSKTEVAPNARGTFAKGSRKELPNKIKEALALQKPKEDTGE
ncbi:hypothetical protein [Photobacterium leiognathi]|uniref:hypothetical protein n=1 Tax=Photobacterium leiognathi TaxID=553611 RepID=UPI0029823F98|nr:hypothetical protein [Photobacterium leiognathi]